MRWAEQARKKKQKLCVLIYITSRVVRSTSDSMNSSRTWHISPSTFTSNVMSENDVYWRKYERMPFSRSSWLHVEGMQTAQLMCEKRGVRCPYWRSIKEREKNCHLRLYAKLKQQEKKEQRHPHLWSCSWKTRTTELIGGDRALCHFSIAAGDRQCNTFLVIDSSWCLNIDQNHHTDSHCHWKFHLVSWRLHRALKEDGKYRKSTTNISSGDFSTFTFFSSHKLQLYLTFQSPKL